MRAPLRATTCEHILVGCSASEDAELLTDSNYEVGVRDCLPLAGLRDGLQVRRGCAVHETGYLPAHGNPGIGACRPGVDKQQKG